ncbi:hypothetical protein KSP40_PGU011163 [Platanthera guangdongensis]|uniref:Uncharacterized protein n=1 Tax=Platanthera guangdongensis TaxID=2320717 RepID=A0ABR2N2R8_9ASPA
MSGFSWPHVTLQVALAGHADGHQTCNHLGHTNMHGGPQTSGRPTVVEQWATFTKSPALPWSLWLYKKLHGMGLQLILLTGRKETHRNSTEQNLLAVGYHSWDKLILRLEKCGSAKSMWVMISELMGGSEKAGICCQPEDEAYVGVLASEDEGKDLSDSIRAPVSVSETEETSEESSSDEDDTTVTGSNDNNTKEQVTSSSCPVSLEISEDRNCFPSENSESLKRALQKSNLLVEEQAQEIVRLKILLVLQLASNKVKDSKISDLESSLENEKRIVSNFSKVDVIKRKQENGWISRIINSWRNGETVFRPPTPSRKATHHAFRYDHRNNRGHYKGDLSSCGDTRSARAVVATHERIPKAHSKPFVFTATASTRCESACTNSQNTSHHPRTHDREVRSHGSRNSLPRFAMAPRTTAGLVTGCELVRTGFAYASDEFRNIILMLEEAGLSFVLEHPCKILNKEIARDAVADIQEESDAVEETADEGLEGDADENDQMDDEGEEEGNEGQEALETRDIIEAQSDKHAPEIVPENIGATVEWESEKSTEAARTPPLETVVVSSSTGASADEQGKEVPQDLPLRDDLATHTVNVIQGIVDELKASFEKGQNKMLKRIKKSENLMLKNMVEINHKLDVMEKKFEDKYTAAGQAVTLLMEGLKRNTDTLTIVNQNAHVVANNIQKFDGNMGAPAPEDYTVVDEGASVEEVPVSEADVHRAARASSKAKLMAMFDQGALAKARDKRKSQEGTSKETQAKKRIRLKEEEVFTILNNRTKTIIKDNKLSFQKYGRAVTRVRWLVSACKRWVVELGHRAQPQWLSERSPQDPHSPHINSHEKTYLRYTITLTQYSTYRHPLRILYMSKLRTCPQDQSLQSIHNGTHGHSWAPRLTTHLLSLQSPKQNVIQIWNRRLTPAKGRLTFFGRRSTIYTDILCT